MRWQVQDAKQRFSEFIRTAHADGPQVVTLWGSRTGPLALTWSSTRPARIR
jgi:prevent-host-death family protein